MSSSKSRSSSNILCTDSLNCRFLFDGRQFNDDETPRALEMEQVDKLIHYVTTIMIMNYFRTI